MTIPAPAPAASAREAAPDQIAGRRSGTASPSAGRPGSSTQQRTPSASSKHRRGSGGDEPKRAGTTGPGIHWGRARWVWSRT